MGDFKQLMLWVATRCNLSPFHNIDTTGLWDVLSVVLLECGSCFPNKEGINTGNHVLPVRNNAGGLLFSFELLLRHALHHDRRARLRRGIVVFSIRVHMHAFGLDRVRGERARSTRRAVRASEVPAQLAAPARSTVAGACRAHVQREAGEQERGERGRGEERGGGEQAEERAREGAACGVPGAVSELVVVGVPPEIREEIGWKMRQRGGGGRGVACAPAARMTTADARAAPQIAMEKKVPSVKSVNALRAVLARVRRMLVARIRTQKRARGRSPEAQISGERSGGARSAGVHTTAADGAYRRDGAFLEGLRDIVY